MVEMKSKLRIGILGPGGIGGLLAALFWRSGHSVICIGNNHSVKQINSSGLSIDSAVYGKYIAEPKASEKLSCKVDILFIAVKSQDLSEALKRVEITSIQNGIVVSLLNGIGHSSIIRDQLGKTLAVGTIGHVEAIKVVGGVKHLSSWQPQIEVASNSDIPNEKLRSLVKIMNTVGLVTSVLQREEEVIWNKLARLNAIASMTAAYQCTIGEVMADDKATDLLIGLVEEGVQVAQKEGVCINSNEVLNQIKKLPNSLTTSLKRDIEEKKHSELEFITGGVIAFAKKYGISTPKHEQVYDLINNLFNK